MKIFITGSSDGIGQLAALDLIKQGHQVVIHARNKERGEQALRKVPKAEQVLLADLSSISETINLASEVNKIGKFDAIIHNAGIYSGPKGRIFTVNCLAPYILTSLIKKPERLVYISSGMHLQGRPNLNTISKGISYSDSKLYLVVLAMAVARKWPTVYANTVNPGWVPTKMGGANAPDNLQKGVDTQVWLAVNEEAKVSGKYFFHQEETRYNKEVLDTNLQDKFLKTCEEVSGVHFPD